MEDCSITLDTAINNPFEYTLYFRDVDTSGRVFDKPHYYIILPTITNELIVLSMITSQVEKVLKKYENIDQDTLVILSKEDIPDILTKEKSIIDCNIVKVTTLQELYRKMDLKIFKAHISKELIEKIYNGIQKSPVVKTKIKKNITKG
ncbi:hypothetical protein [Campylobacter fetus]|uniref:hypothetical protein n=1 Tax=Campylobacter fetus TaxID=196 RepID=UPI000FCA5AB1|nr:hypothetical protein [Campylobacter fetus]RUT51006.1 hypothetical protein BWK67_00335 [Campylobacter fetus]RUT51734.1 hypothetical protein BWK51_00335 [Campylobacter fetus]